MKSHFWLAVVLSVVSSAAGATELAKVNGKPITDTDLKKALGTMNEGQRSAFLADVNNRRQVLIGLIDQELLTQTAEKEKLDQDAEFKEAMNAFRRQLLATRLVEKNLGAKVTPSAEKKFYEGHKHRFSTDQVHVQHILAADEPTAKEILKEVKEPNADFQEIAEKRSRDPSAKNNRGDLGFISQDSAFVDEFKDAAFAAHEGEITGPVKTLYGYHIIRVIEKKTGKILNFDEVELKVRSALRQELYNVYVGKLKQQAKVQVDDKAIDRL